LGELLVLGGVRAGCDRGQFGLDDAKARQHPLDELPLQFHAGPSGEKWPA